MIVISIIAVVLFALSRSAAVEATYPFMRLKTLVGRTIGARLVGAWRGAEAEAENLRLRREAASLALVNDDLARLEAENVRLREALGYVESHPGRWIAATVVSVGGGAANVRRMVRVDKGSLAGVALNAAVTVPGGLVGRVTAVTPHTAEVLLLNDATSRVACRVESDLGRLEGILEGTIGGGLVLKHLQGLKEGAVPPPRCRVYSSGAGGVFPEGIPVGALLEVREERYRLSSEGEVAPAVDFATLEDVFIRSET